MSLSASLDFRSLFKLGDLPVVALGSPEVVNVSNTQLSKTTCLLAIRINHCQLDDLMTVS